MCVGGGVKVKGRAWSQQVWGQAVEEGPVKKYLEVCVCGKWLHPWKVMACHKHRCPGPRAPVTGRVQVWEEGECFLSRDLPGDSGGGPAILDSAP